MATTTQPLRSCRALPDTWPEKPATPSFKPDRQTSQKKSPWTTHGSLPPPESRAEAVRQPRDVEVQGTRDQEQLARKRQVQATRPSTDCPMSRAAFLLAQASLATQLSSGTVEFEKRRGSCPSSQGPGHLVLRFGPGLDGTFSNARGFLAEAREVAPLPPALSQWDAVHARLPRLLRAGRVRHAVDRLGRGSDAKLASAAWISLPERHLSRAALVLSALAHAYMFGADDVGQRPPVPSHVLVPWSHVCHALGRPVTGRVPADDLLNNATGDSDHGLSSVYFGLPEERLSSGLQGTMEAVFAPALGIMGLTQSAVLADEPGQVATCLEQLAGCVVRCALVFLDPAGMALREPYRFDPVVWIKTYPAMGRAVVPGELGNSGVDAPLFHALDAFVGRKGVKGDLRAMQADRRATFPLNVRALLEALADEAAGVKAYVAARRGEGGHARLSAAWDTLLQVYVWFLERHRVRAVGVTGVSLATGRHTTSSGVKSCHQAVKALRPEAMLSRQMKAGMASRLGGRPSWQYARLQSRRAYEGTVVVVLRLDANMPLEPGDRVHIWPPSKRKRPCIRSRDDDHDNDGDDDEDDDDDDDTEPRFYSVAHVDGAPNAAHGMTITLTVGQHAPAGVVSSFLATAALGTKIRLRPWPCVNFRQPHDLSTPLVLVGQGSGVGPLLGFLHERARWTQSAKTDAAVAPLLLLMAAKTMGHVPCPLETLQKLTAQLPLTVILALSQDTHCMVRDGACLPMTTGERHITRHLAEYRDTVQQRVTRDGGHVFVCGSVDFGSLVLSRLGLDVEKGQHEKQLPKTGGHRAYIPLPPMHWAQVHQDLFSNQQRFPSPSTTANVISPFTLAMHNSPTSCWTCIHGTVYDLSDFLTTHPGGAKTLLESAGTVGDARFDETHGGPDAQWVRGLLAARAVGRLSTSLSSSSTSTTPACHSPALQLLDTLVRMQNALANNTAFAASRAQPVPLYVFADALLVFADGLDAVAVAAGPADAVANVQARLRDTFLGLRAACKTCLAVAGARGHDITASEEKVMQAYMAPVASLHAAIDGCKRALARADGEGTLARPGPDEDDVVGRVVQGFVDALMRVADSVESDQSLFQEARKK